MSKKIYVGNLGPGTDETSLRQAFSAYGEVLSCNIVMDRLAASARGFGFVELADEQVAAAIAGMNGQTIDGRVVRVCEAFEKRGNDRNNHFKNRY
jgi:RNA recognition motif-containing protein